MIAGILYQRKISDHIPNMPATVAKNWLSRFHARHPEVKILCSPQIEYLRALRCHDPHVFGKIFDTVCLFQIELKYYY